MFTAYEWFTAIQGLVMLGATVLLWRMRTSISTAVDTADTKKRLVVVELEIQRLREWRHKEVVLWQQTLEGKIEEKYVTLREYQAAHPDGNERRKRPRP